MKLRPYQAAAFAAVNQHFAEKDTNPVIVIPTGGGKTIIMAEMIRFYLTHWPQTRIAILAHVGELVQQNATKLMHHWPDAPMGVYCAGLGYRDTEQNVIFASIQSVHRRAAELGRFDLVFVDEAHRIPTGGEGMYRRFLADCERFNPNLRVVGFTATPYRMNTGYVAAPDHLLQETCYEADVATLIENGFLCQLTTKATGVTPNLKGVKIRNGDYVPGQLEEAMSDEAMIAKTASELKVRGADRKAWLVFCTGVHHAQLVSDALAKLEIEAPVLHADTPKGERADLIRRFNAGTLRALVNINVLSEGFDAPHVDLIAMLRPTKSPGLYYQQVGRGLRLHPDKTNCLVLDFAGNVPEHGPIDDLTIKGKQKTREDGESPVKKCPECDELVAAGVRTCPACGYQWPVPVVKHDTVPDETVSVLSGRKKKDPVNGRFAVTSVSYHRHAKRHQDPDNPKPDTVRVVYTCGLRTFDLWLCFEHTGYARARSVQWWINAHKDTGAGAFYPIPTTTAAALALLTDGTAKKPAYITVNLKSRFFDVIDIDYQDDALDEPQPPARVPARI